MCRAWETTGGCARGDSCRFQHSWAGYWEVKPSDIHHEVAAQLAESEPFVRAMAPRMGGEDLMGKTIDLTTQCPVFKDLGYCTYGWRCRFLGGHVKHHDDKEGADQWDLLGFKDPSSMSETERYNETNWPKSDTLTRLKHNKVSFASFMA
jgi:tRNA-dihydrouridine synthase 3